MMLAMAICNMTYASKLLASKLDAFLIGDSIT